MRTSQTEQFVARQSRQALSIAARDNVHALEQVNGDRVIKQGLQLTDEVQVGSTLVLINHSAAT